MRHYITHCVKEKRMRNWGKFFNFLEQSGMNEGTHAGEAERPTESDINGGNT